MLPTAHVSLSRSLWSGADFLAPRGERPSRTVNLLQKGFVLPWKGYLFLKGNPRLWRYAWVPALLGLVVFAGSLWGLGSLSFHWFEIWTLDWADSNWFWQGLRFVVQALVIITTLAVSGLLAAILSLLFLQEAYGRLALQVLKVAQPGAIPASGLTVWSSLKDSLASLFEILLINLVLFVVGFIPAIGAPLALCGGIFFNSYFLGLEILSYPLGLYGRRRREQRTFAKRNRLLVHGLGGAALALLTIPVLGQFLLSAAVAGSTLWLGERSAEFGARIDKL